jgi:HD-like signal output (HDOD) protein
MGRETSAREAVVSGENSDINQILDTLGRLKDRVTELDALQASGRDQAARQDTLIMLRAGLAELDGLVRPAEFAPFFARYAGRTGLRMLLLKQWRSGLQVCAERNITMPPEARSKRSDGRAPIPTEGEDLFAIVGRERQVYAGPVPLKAFPTDLTLLMGRGAEDRRIVVLPLPSRDRWTTFIYLDGDRDAEVALTVAEFLARHAVDRLRLMQKGEHPAEGQVASLLKQELHRRRDRLRQRAAQAAPQLGQRANETALAEPEESMTEPPPLQWVHRDEESSTEAESGQSYEPLEMDDMDLESPPPPVSRPLPVSARRASEARQEADAIVKAWEEAVLGVPVATEAEVRPATPPPAPMAPEDILHKSGDLPAMPKAALHILSVIEDPRTTATRLEKAVAMDQALTAKILRIANSPFYGAVREIKTVSEAIVRLGFVTIRNWTLVTATKSVFLGAGAGVLFQKIWRQSVLSAMAAQLVAQVTRRAEPETVFVGGLMQNIGQLVLARSHPELFQQVLTVSAEEGLPYHVVEQELLGFDHGDLGALLIKEWNLSEELEQAVRWHHRLDHPDIECRDLAALVALGEEVAACTGSADQEDEALRWEHSRGAGVLGLRAPTFQRLRAEALELSIDPALFT